MKARELASLRGRLWRGLGARAAALRCAAEEAERAGARALLVGGPVRDLLLRQPIGDLDLLLSASLDRVARRTAKRLGGRATIHESFLTATVSGDGFRIDFAQARRESYPRPGALPVVEAASVADDLKRRDFSVNAIALRLYGEGAGPLDPHGGIADLERGVLRVLHDGSFRDDPTRLWRAARYAARLGFRLEPATRRLAREAVAEGALDTISGDRVRHELERLLQEERPGRAARASEALGLFGALRRGWTVRDLRPLARLARARERPPWPELAGQDVLARTGLALLLLDVHARLRVPALTRIGVRGRPARATAADLARLSALRRQLDTPPSPGRLDAALAGASESALLLAWCAGPGALSRQVARYAVTLRHLPDPLNGHRARRLGAAGPSVGALLRSARTRALDGREVDDAWLRSWLARHG